VLRKKQSQQCLPGLNKKGLARKRKRGREKEREDEN
jgi:hypothetical protein